MTANDVSPYLQRPVRRLEEVIAEVEQQRLEQALVVSTGTAAEPRKAEDPISIASAPS